MSSSSFRRMLATPLGVFENFKGLRTAYPSHMNWYYMFCSLFALMIVGRGAEKRVTQNEDRDKFHAEWRAQRGYLPFWMASYRHKFPKFHGNQQ